MSVSDQHRLDDERAVREYLADMDDPADREESVAAVLDAVRRARESCPCCPTGPRPHDTGSRTEADAAAWAAAHAPDDDERMTRWDDLR